MFDYWRVAPLIFLHYPLLHNIITSYKYLKKGSTTYPSLPQSQYHGIDVGFLRFSCGFSMVFTGGYPHGAPGLSRLKEAAPLQAALHRAAGDGARPRGTALARRQVPCCGAQQWRLDEIINWKTDMYD